MQPTDELWFEPLRALARRLRGGDVSATELARASIARLERIGVPLNAVSLLTEDLALAQARAADRRLRQGDPSPLCGIPWAPKDVLATAGHPTAWGAPQFRDRAFAFDATVVERLASAGAVLVGKLALVELGGAGLYRGTNASKDGPARNPWDLRRWAGGSSSGSAAAVAAGLTGFSIGAETGGSLVVPAAFCGATALRPTFGLVSQHGALRLAWSMDKLGPVGRSADDCALVLAAITGADARDPTTVDWAYAEDGRRRFRLGVLPPPEDAAAAPAFAAALEVFAAQGHDITTIDPPEVDAMGIYDRLFAGEVGAEHEAFIRDGGAARLIDQAQREALAGHLERGPTAYPRAAHERVAAVQVIRRTFGDVDAIVAPTVFTEAVELDADLLEYRRRRRGGNMLLGALAGTPELTVPMGLGPSGLPVGLSILGDVRTDATVLRVGALYQEATSWHLARPPVARTADVAT